MFRLHVTKQLSSGSAWRNHKLCFTIICAAIQPWQSFSFQDIIFVDLFISMRDRMETLMFCQFQDRVLLRAMYGHGGFPAISTPATSTASTAIAYGQGVSPTRSFYEDTASSPDRSRSPRSSLVAMSQHRASMPSLPQVCASSPLLSSLIPAGPAPAIGPAWSTGRHDCDQWLVANIRDPMVFAELVTIPVGERRQLVSCTMKKNPPINSPDKWVMKCINNVQQKHSQTIVPRPQASPMNYVPGPPVAWPDSIPKMQIPGAGASSLVSSATILLPGPLRSAVPLPAGTADGGVISCGVMLSDSNLRSAQQPPWVVQGLKHLEAHSAMLRTVCQVIEEPVLQQFLAMPPSWQLKVATALLLCASAWALPSTYVQEMMRLLPAQRQATATPRQIDGGKPGELNIVLLLNCVGMGTGHLVVSAALRVLKKLHPDVAVNVVSVFSFEIDADALVVESALIKDMGVTASQLGDVAGLPQLITQCGLQWKTAGCFPLLLNSWPCKNTSRAASMPGRPDGSGLHMQHSRAMWPIAHAHMILARQFGSSGFGHLTEYPQCGNAGEERTVDTYFGTAFENNPRVYNAANRPRRIRTSPSAHSIQQHHAMIDPHGPFDGWSWCGNGQQEVIKAPLVTLRSHLIRLAESTVFGDRVLQEFEVQALDRCRMRHADTGEIRLINRRFWLHWLGMAQSPIEKILDSLWPCLQSIHSASGMPAELIAGGEPCGKSRWCMHCERCYEMLGQAWHLTSMADCLVAVIKQIIAKHVHHQEAVQFFDTPDHEPHMCGPSCVSNPKLGF